MNPEILHAMLCRRLAEVVGGKFEAPAGGTVEYKLELPLAQHGFDFAPGDENANGSEAYAPVLVVDEKTDCQAMVAFAMKPNPVEGAATLEEALEMLEAKAYGVVLLCAGPGMERDIEDACRYIGDKHPATRIFVCLNAEADDRDAGRYAGIAEILRRPLDIHSIRAAMQGR